MFVCFFNVLVCTKFLHFHLAEAILVPTFIFVQFRSHWGTKWFMNIPIPSAVSFSYNIHCCFLVFTFPPSLSSYLTSLLHVGRSSFTSFSPLKKTSLQTSTSLTPSCTSVIPISKHVTIMICDLHRLTHCSSSSVTCSSASRYSCDSLSRSGSTSTVRPKK